MSCGSSRPFQGRGLFVLICTQGLPEPPYKISNKRTVRVLFLSYALNKAVFTKTLYGKAF